MNIEQTLMRWHDFVANPGVEILEEIIADEVKFHSPFVWKPKEGKEAKEKWWNLTARGRKDTGSGVLKGLVRRGKCTSFLSFLPLRSS